MIKQIPIWSSRLRLIHGFFILSYIALLLSGWWLTDQENPASDSLVLHQVASSVFAVLLFFRLALLLLGKQAENIKSFFNQGEKLQQINKLLAFYFTLGKLPLPNWHSKSALWSLLYLLMFVVMLAVLVTGVLLGQQDMLMGWVLLDLHILLNKFLFWLIGFHIVTAVWHDVKSTNANISAMLNGDRYFFIEEKKPSEVTVKFK